jgi:hypothetical protein
MNALRTASVGLAIVAGLLVLSGSLAFSSATAERSVSVDVVNDNQAFIGYESNDIQNLNASKTDEVTAVEIENRFSQDVRVTDLTLASTSDSVQLSNPDQPDIQSGHSESIRATVERCEPGASATVSVTVTVSGDGIKAQLSDGGETRSFEVSCADEN